MIQEGQCTLPDSKSIQCHIRKKKNQYNFLLIFIHVFCTCSKILKGTLQMNNLVENKKKMYVIA